jgi:hypothetical protein
VTVRLPEEARRYFDAVAAGDAQAASLAFAPDAVVVDVDRPIAGRAAIEAWAQAEVVGGTYRIVAADARPDGDGGDGGVSILLEFTPPGEREAFRARYSLRLRGGLIARAELAYA